MVAMLYCLKKKESAKQDKVALDVIICYKPLWSTLMHFWPVKGEPMQSAVSFFKIQINLAECFFKKVVQVYHYTLIIQHDDY